MSKVVLVTGASTGIGSAIASRLARDGHTVFGTSRGGVDAPDGVEPLPLDVTDDASVRACVHIVLARTGRIDALVNNAGFLLAGAIEEATLDQARQQMETNYFGVVRMVKAVLPTLRQQRSGAIVTVSSLAGLVPVPFWGYYNASKFAVEGFCETLRYEVQPFGIKVALVEPGAIKTPFYEAPTAAPLPAYSPWRERVLKTMAGFAEAAPGPELVADRVARLVVSDRPPLRTPITREAWQFTTLRRWLPARWFEAGSRQGFNLDRVGFESS